MKHILFLCSFLAASFTAFASDIAQSVIRVAVTSQNYSPTQPWNKTAPFKKNALAAVLNSRQVLTTAEMVANANFIQLETPNGEHQFPAKVVTVDYEANLALLAPTSEKGKTILKDFKGLSMAQSAHLGDTAEIVQIASNGMPLITKGHLQTVDILSGFVAGHYFLTYEIKASMQSAANSYTVPALKDGKLLGLLTSYSSENQIANLIAPEIITAFLKDAQDGTYLGFPTLGVAASNTTDTHFREWLKLPQDKGGIYIQRVKRHSSADKAGVKPGDVLIAINGKPIDRRGYYQANGYGQLYWSHLIRGAHTTGSTVSLTLLRDGKQHQLTAKLERSPEGIIPTHMHDKAPHYLVKGGFVFQELTKSYLQAFGKNWNSRAPLSLLDALNHPEDYEQGRKRLVFLSATLNTPATLGYANLRSVIVEEVNGQAIQDIPSLIKAFQQTPTNGIHTIKIDGQPKTIYLDALTSDQVDAQLLQRGLPSLSRETD